MKNILLKIISRINLASELFLRKNQWKELTSKANVIIPQKLFLNKTFQLVVEKSETSKIAIAGSVNCRNNCFIYVGNNAELIIEDNVFFNNSCSVNCLESITIGKNTMFGEGVKIYDHNHSYEKNNGELNIALNQYTKGKITIGANSWIGSNVVILKGVTIGDNVIIGANTVVHKSVPSNTILINKQNLETIEK